MLKKKTCSNRSVIAWVVGVTLAALLLFTVWFLMHRSKLEQDDIIANHVQQLVTIFKKINEDCGIIGFEDEGGSRKKNYIDFLTVKAVAGSQIGSLNVLHPDKWQGPYVAENITAQEHYYYVIRIKGEYYIIPGDGMKLSNGKIIGKDIIIDTSSKIEDMIKDPTALNYNGRPLAAHLEIKKVAAPAPVSSNID